MYFAHARGSADLHQKMGRAGDSRPRTVCCAIPIARTSGKVLLVTSRKRPHLWVCKYMLPAPSSESDATQCPRVDGKRPTLHWRLPLVERHLKKVTRSRAPRPRSSPSHILSPPCSRRPRQDHTSSHKHRWRNRQLPLF